MNRDQAREKVEKLLALAKSDNENEAQAALLAARRLMAQHKISERDIEKDSSKELRKVFYYRESFSGIRNAWFSSLAQIVAKHHCCCSIERGAKGSTIRNVGFVGLGDDPDIACTIFDYAVHFIDSWGRSEKEYFRRMYRVSDRKRMAEDLKNTVNSYALGFASGLEKQYDEQDADTQEITALVLVKPIQVEEYEKGLSESTLKIKSRPLDKDTYMDGFSDGYRFKPTPQIR